MAKKDFGEAKNFSDAVETLTTELAKYGLKIIDDNKAVEQLRTALANLGLKIIEDINTKRVQKPEEVYNALVAIYNAIK